jgi:hypothetical protein
MSDHLRKCLGEQATCPYPTEYIPENTVREYHENIRKRSSILRYCKHFHRSKHLFSDWVHKLKKNKAVRHFFNAGKNQISAARSGIVKTSTTTKRTTSKMYLF